MKKKIIRLSKCFFLYSRFGSWELRQHSVFMSSRVLGDPGTRSLAELMGLSNLWFMSKNRNHRWSATSMHCFRYFSTLFGSCRLWSKDLALYSEKTLHSVFKVFCSWHLDDRFFQSSLRNLFSKIIFKAENIPWNERVLSESRLECCWNTLLLKTVFIVSSSTKNIKWQSTHFRKRLYSSMRLEASPNQVFDFLVALHWLKCLYGFNTPTS